MHGYLTRDGIRPAEFTELGRRELPAYGIEMRCVGVTGARPMGNQFAASLSDGTEVMSRFLLIATGVVDDLPGIPGFDDCYGRTIFHCPYCDGWEQRDKRLAAFGSGKHGTALALGLKAWSADVLLCTNGAALDRRGRERLDANGIAVREQRVAGVEHENGGLRAIRFAGGSRHDGNELVERDALFFTTGQHPQSPLAITLGCQLTRHGTVKTGTLCETNIPRVFVAGDASRDAQFVVVAAAEGVKAAVAINKALQAEDLRA